MGNWLCRPGLCAGHGSSHHTHGQEEARVASQSSSSVLPTGYTRRCCRGAQTVGSTSTRSASSLDTSHYATEARRLLGRHSRHRSGWDRAQRQTLEIVQAVAGCPLDDSAQGMPHAQLMRLVRHARGAEWPWLASTQRLSQSLCDCRDMLASTDLSLDAVWCGYTSVVRASSAQGIRPAQI